MRRVLPAVAALGLLLTGCGSESPAPAPTPPAAPQPSAAQGGEDSPAKQDVTITKCAANGYTQDVTIEVHNSTDTPWKYVVGIDIKNAKGEASEARFVKNRVERGQTLTADIPGGTPLKGEVTCTVGEVKRLAPQ